MGGCTLSHPWVHVARWVGAGSEAVSKTHSPSQTNTIQAARPHNLGHRGGWLRTATAPGCLRTAPGMAPGTAPGMGGTRAT